MKFRPTTPSASTECPSSCRKREPHRQVVSYCPQEWYGLQSHHAHSSPYPQDDDKCHNIPNNVLMLPQFDFKTAMLFLRLKELSRKILFVLIWFKFKHSFRFTAIPPNNIFKDQGLSQAWQKRETNLSNFMRRHWKIYFSTCLAHNKFIFLYIINIATVNSAVMLMPEVNNSTTTIWL